MGIILDSYGATPLAVKTEYIAVQRGIDEHGDSSGNL